MKVCVVLEDLDPTRHALWREIGRRGVQLHFAYSRRGDDDDAHPALSEAGTVHRLDRTRVRRGHHTWVAYRGLSELVDRLDPDIVHVLHEPWALAVTQVAGRRARIVPHGAETLWTQGSRAESALRLAVSRRNLRLAAGFASWNQPAILWARRYGLPAERPTAVFSPNMPDPSLFDRRGTANDARQRWGLGTGFVAGYVGRLVPEKGVRDLLDAWRGSDLGAEARLVIVGEGPLGGEVRQAQTADPRIISAGLLAPTDIAKIMAALDVLVCPSITTPRWAEQWGRVLAEAMTIGTPVIATRSGAIPEVVGDAAHLVEEGDIAGLRTALLRLSVDPEERGRLQRLGLTRAATEYSVGSVTDRVLAFWERVCATPPPHRAFTAGRAGGRRASR